MTVSDDYKTFLADQLAGFGPVSIRRMFGGAGVYHQGVMFALIADDTLYFKTDEESRAAFESVGMGPFAYGTQEGRRVVTSYWQAPDRLFDDPEALADWARRAYAIALKTGKGKAKRLKPRKRRRGSPSSPSRRARP